MANHCKIIDTKVAVTHEAVTATLSVLLQRLTGEVVKLEYFPGTKGESYGEHNWVISCGDFLTRIAFINDEGQFEIRHGGGGDFSWWIDHAITNQVALDFQGRICDEGLENPFDPVPGKFDDYNAYLLRKYTGMGGAVLGIFRTMGVEDTPKELHYLLGPEFEPYKPKAS